MASEASAEQVMLENFNLNKVKNSCVIFGELILKLSLCNFVQNYN